MYDSAGLLALWNRLTGRAATDVITADDKYQLLAEAQTEVISEVASMAPETLYQRVGTASLPTLSTVDHNVFTFGVGVTPFGSVQIFRTLSDVPDRPLLPDLDYIAEGDQIRIPHNRQFAAPLYWRGAVMPPPITATVPPALIPSEANELTAIRAARNFAEGGNIRNSELVDRLERRYAQRIAHWALLWRRQYSHGGALRSYSLKDLLTPL